MIPTEKLTEQLSAETKIQRSIFFHISHTLDDLLYAADGVKELARLSGTTNHYTLENGFSEQHPEFLIESMGKYVQALRNKLASQLQPVFEAFDAEPPSY